MTYQSLTLEFGKDSHLLFDRSLRRLRDSPNAKIHDIERVQPQVSDIVMHTVDQFLTRKSVNPGLVFTTAGTDLGDNYHAVRIRMKRFLNNLIRHMRAVEVARIDMVHAC